MNKIHTNFGNIWDSKLEIQEIMCLVLLLQQLEHIFCADICHNTTTIKYLGVAALFGV